jgi:hypothetical protein
MNAECDYCPYNTETVTKKRALEQDLGRIIVLDEHLPPYKLYLLGETLGHIEAGRYSLAHSSLVDLRRDPSEFAAFGNYSAGFAIPTREALLCRLQYIRGVPAREYPAF